jgi:hypothetical protein
VAVHVCGNALGLAPGSFSAINVAAYPDDFGGAHLGEIRGLIFMSAIVGAGPSMALWMGVDRRQIRRGVSGKHDHLCRDRPHESRYSVSPKLFA